MPSNAPNFGTGFVDWGNYVNANMPNTQADRAKVGNYLNQQYGQLQQMNGGSDFDATQAALSADQSALQTPGGFEQVLAAANSKYDPTGKDAQGNYKAPPGATNDPFSSALEGQNAAGLFKGHPEMVAPKDANPPGTQPPAPPRPDVPTGPSPGGMQEGPYQKPRGRKPNPDWSSFGGG